MRAGCLAKLWVFGGAALAVATVFNKTGVDGLCRGLSHTKRCVRTLDVVLAEQLSQLPLSERRTREYHDAGGPLIKALDDL